MKTVRQIEQSNRMRKQNAASLPKSAEHMYLDRKVKLLNAVTASSRANKGKGWVSPSYVLEKEADSDEKE